MNKQGPEDPRRWQVVAGVSLLLLILFAQLALSVRRESQTSDEACHIFAGYRYWKNFDFGINPEHPPLVKLVAALPLLWMPLRTPPISNDYFMVMEFENGREFVYANDASTVLWRARLAAASFTVILAISIFFIAHRMCGLGPAFLALALFVFDPNFLAHGALVTTDVGASLGFFLGVGSFYLYLKKPSAPGLMAAGLAAGVCLGAKHSGIVLFPILFVLALTELFPLREPVTKRLAPGLANKALRLASSLAVIGVIAVVVLWGLYGFRYAARPAGLEVNPPFLDFVSHTTVTGSSIVLKIARWHLLPESYLYGLVTVYSQGAIPTALFGKHYASAQWFYFPIIFVVKSTLALLILCLLAPFASALWKSRYRREVLFLATPFAIYFAAAMASGVNRGGRHLLPAYPFLIVLVSFGAWSLSQKHKVLAATVVALVAFHAVSSLRAFPNYIPYSNELWGGPDKTYRILTDSDVDWGQGLLAMKQYLNERQIKNCWFAYSNASLSLSYYGISCQPLPTAFADKRDLPMPVVPAQVDGPVFISSSEISGPYWHAEWANPYLPFQHIPPAKLIAGAILVYDGKVDISQLSALTHEKVAMQFLQAQKLEQALAEAETAVEISPNRPVAHATRSMVLSAMGRKAEAGDEIRRARTMASTILAAE